MSLELFVELEQNKAEQSLLEQRGEYRVMQHKNYRFLSSGGRAIQGAMDIRQPNSVQSPVVAAMLEGMHLPQTPNRILNLGIGSAAIERFFNASDCDVNLISVEVSRDVIELARAHFLLPSDSITKCMAAENFVDACDTQFDLIFCDLAMNDRPAACLSAHSFQVDCARLISDNGMLVINLLCNNQAELKDNLLEWRRCFSWIAVYAVPAFDNVIVYAGHQPPFSSLEGPRWMGSRDTLDALLVLP